MTSIKGGVAWREAEVRTGTDAYGEPARAVYIYEARIIGSEIRCVWMEPTPSGRSIMAADHRLPSSATVARMRQQGISSDMRIDSPTESERALVERACAGSMFAPEAPLHWRLPHAPQRKVDL